MGGIEKLWLFYMKQTTGLYLWSVKQEMIMPGFIVDQL